MIKKVDINWALKGYAKGGDAYFVGVGVMVLPGGEGGCETQQAVLHIKGSLSQCFRNTKNI